MFALRTRATHDRHRAVVWFQKRGVVPKEGQRGDQLAMQVEDASRDRTRFLSVRPGLRVTQIVFHYCNEGAAQVIVTSGCLRDGPDEIGGRLEQTIARAAEPVARASTAPNSFLKGAEELGHFPPCLRSAP